MTMIMLLVAMFIIAILRVHMPFGAKLEGRPLGQITLSFRERMLVQRTNLYLIGVVVLISTIGGFLRGPLELVAILAAFALLLIPVRYTITAHGIALNNVVFRPWSDFAGRHEERGSIVLEAVEGKRKFRMHVLGANRDAAERALARLLPQPGSKRTSGGARTAAKA